MGKNISITRRVAYGGVLVAISVLLGGPLSIPLNLFGGYMKNISFGAAAVMYAGLLLGPVDGFLVGGISDIVSFLLFPKGGAYFPGFSITMGLIGMLPALILWRKQEPKLWQLFLAVGITHLVCSFGLNSFFLISFYAMSPQIVWIRAGVQCVMIVLYTLVIYPLLGWSKRLLGEKN
ncbi:folate family ECF transporter S component [Eubacteriales bacterium OttesenSCG-928-M02]|nr:folate family ECF transporter S component [Eubacteriales bacterium OttesenSCG-928-M02]